MTPEEILDTCRTQAVRLVRFLYCDNGGVIRGKATHVERLGDRIRTGIGLTVAMQAMNSLDQLQPVEGMGPVGDPPGTRSRDLHGPAVCAAQRGDAGRPRAVGRAAV